MIKLSKNEEFILLSIWKLEDNAYGVTIRREFIRAARRTLHYGSLYNTLELLIRKGLVNCWESQPDSKRGGRRKKLYFLTDKGKRALKEAQAVYRSVWQKVQDLKFEEK
ncbi:MAG: helix-turn-helix transcriptional regulator [Candidatus Aminicenantes bacterium]|jgi:DNA-binding PadR family transcriptional regulator